MGSYSLFALTNFAGFGDSPKFIRKPIKLVKL